MGLLGNLVGISGKDRDVLGYKKGEIMTVNGPSTEIIPVTVWYDYI